MDDRDAFQARIDAVRDRAGIVDVVAGAIALSKGRNPRGKCPFHGSKSDSFAVYPDKGRAKCWGCPWHGCVIQFTADFYRLSFKEALERLEGDVGLADGRDGLRGLDGLAANPVKRERQARMLPDRPVVDSATMGRFIMGLADYGPAAREKARTYLAAGGVPPGMLGDDRLADIGFAAMAPIVPWRVDGKPESVPRAPALAARIRRPELGADGRVLAWEPCGLHVTFLAPDLRDKMTRSKRDGSLYPARKMLGAAMGGAVLLGRYEPSCPLFPGEGIETVLAGMGLAGAGREACGLAVLSLDNLQGHPSTRKGGILPLHDVNPDPKRPPLAFAHDGPVTGLVDADMKPLRGPIDPATGEALGLPLIERRGGPIVRRAITTAERATICGELFVKAWRGAGSRRVRAIRPPMGKDFRDAARELGGTDG